MQTLQIHSWQKSSTHLRGALGAKPFDYEAFRGQIEPAAELTGEPLARLVRRLQAGYPVAIPLRADVDPEPLVSLLKAAGAVVSVSGAVAVDR